MRFSRTSVVVPALLSLTLSLGCRDSSNHGHVHEEEPRTAQITVWTDRYEVFAEHQAPVAGEGTTFITHVTDLHTLEPRREGPVTFVLRQGDTVVEHVEDTPARAGIYLPDLVFPETGEWQLTLAVPTDGTRATVELGVISVFEDSHDAAHADIPEGPEGVSFLKEQQWKILSRTDQATRHRLIDRLRVPARVRAKPGFSATIVAPVSGQLVQANNEALPLPGEHVQAGRLLALLEPHFSEASARVAEAQGEFSTAKAALDQAEAAYNRTKTLAAGQAKSARELEEATLVYEAAKARHAASEALLATFRQSTGEASSTASLTMELRAPIAGILNSVSAGPGEVVAAHQPLFTILNPEAIWIEARIPESGVRRLSRVANATVEVPGESGRFIPVTGEGRGRLLSVGLAVDDITRTVPLIYETSNRENQFRVGEDVTIHIETDQVEDAVAVPESALVEEGDQLIAFVQLSGETFEKREIDAGIRDNGFVQVLDGIEEGERVVTKGAYAIRLSSISGVIPAHGHAH